MSATTNPTTGHANPFRLMALPPELRNRIYREALVASGPIHITRKKNKANPGRGRINCIHLTGNNVCVPCHTNHHKDDYLLEVSIAVLGGVSGRKKCIVPLHAHYSSALTRATRQIKNEAHEILYAENAFEFADPASFEMFCNRIGGSGALLWNVTIHGFDGHTDKLAALHPDCKLHELVLEGKYPEWPGGWPLTGILRTILPLVGKRGTKGCYCEAGDEEYCTCRTAEQQRAFDVLTVKASFKKNTPPGVAARVWDWETKKVQLSAAWDAHNIAIVREKRKVSDEAAAQAVLAAYPQHASRTA